MKTMRAAAWLVLFASASALAQGMGKMAMPRVELGASAVFAADGTLLAVAKQGEHVMLYRSGDEGRS